MLQEISRLKPGITAGKRASCSTVHVDNELLQQLAQSGRGPDSFFDQVAYGLQGSDRAKVVEVFVHSIPCHDRQAAKALELWTDITRHKSPVRVCHFYVDRQGSELLHCSGRDDGLQEAWSRGHWCLFKVTGLVLAREKRSRARQELVFFLEEKIQCSTNY